MRKLFSLFVALLATTTLWAQRFQSGDLYYNITSNSSPYTVEVTYENWFMEDNYSNLTTVTIPETVTYNGNTYHVTNIGAEAFWACESFTSITIGNGITSIDTYDFYTCSSLASITIGNGVTNIANGALSLPSITSIVVAEGNTIYDSRDSCNAIIETATNSLIAGCQNTIIPNSVTSLGNYAFQGCSSLTSITIPNSVTTLGNYAFEGCTSLTSIICLSTTPPTISSNLCDKGETLIYIPDNALSAYQSAWGSDYLFVNNENSLTLHVETPGTLADLILNVGIRPMNVAKLTLTGTLNDDDFTLMRETMTSLVDVDLSGITNTTGVDFGYNHDNLMKILLPANLTSIGDWAFVGCPFTAITIPNSVTSIGEGAFYACRSLTSLTIPNSVTSIGGVAFWECTSLKSITIGNSVMRIYNETFRNCTSLTSVTIGNSVTSVGRWAFWNCISLKSITIGNSVTSIGERAFEDCSSLTSVTIGNSVTSIGVRAFENCSSLTSITIPNSVKSIGKSAFEDCSSLTSITCLGSTPPEASDLEANTTTCILTVPHSAYNAYLRHAYWGQFLNINTGYWITLQANNAQWGEVTGAGLYAQEATITATPNEGYTFLRWSDGNTDNPRTIQVTSDTTLTAEFDVDTRRLVTFVDWDGTILSSVRVTPGEAATAPADPTREGYTFIGWDKDFSAVTDHMTVTAQYQINRYRVRFFDDKTLLKTDSVAYQSAAIAPANPYHEGYTFIGWDQAFDSITSDLDVYAMYEMGEDRDMTIVFTNSEDNDNEILSQSITIKIPAAPEIAGFTFLYWQPVAEPITNVITIQAIYEADVPSSAPEVYINPANPAQKLLRNGQVYILQDGKTYTIMGAKIQ